MKKFRIAILFLIFFSIAGVLPLIQQSLSPMKLAGLQGAFDKGKQPVFVLKSYFEGEYQKKMDYYLQYNTAFNGELVRLRNQIDYVLFGNINTILTLGKNNYIFDPNYIAARKGENLLSDSSFNTLKKSIESTVYLLKKHNIPLLVVAPPNKANYYSEYLPTSSPEGLNTNKKIISELILNKGEFYLDADSWFINLKDTSKYPLIPKYGAHWSTYGATIAGDSVLQMISSILNMECARFSISDIDLSASAQFTDNDYLPSLNLMTKWESPVLAYPTIKFLEGYKPNALIISDSFIWNWYDMEIIQNCFGDESVLLYYFKTIYDSNRNKIGPFNESLSLEQLLNYDIIIIMNSEAGLPNFGYGVFQHIQTLVDGQ